MDVVTRFWRTLHSVAIGIVLGFPSIALGQAALVPQPTNDRFTLNNGLEVVLQPWVKSGQVAVLLSYEVGARDEPEGFAQLAHVVEHLSFRGSRHLASYQQLTLLRDSGASVLNATTGYDQTQYYAVVPATALERALWLESERMAFTLESFSVANLELEKETVANELHLRLRERRFGSRLMLTALGFEHPFAPSVDPLGDLANMQLSHAQGFWQHYYRPDNARLVIVGDIELKSTRQWVEHYFGPIKNPQRARPARRPNAPSRQAPAGLLVARRLFVEDYVTQGRLVGLWWVPNSDPQQEATLLVFAGLLRTVLQNKVAEEELVNSVASQLERWGAEHFFTVNLRLQANANAGALEAKINSAIEDVFSSNQRALAVTQRRLTIAALQQAQDPLAIARSIAASLLRNGNPVDLSAKVQAFSGVTMEDVRALRPLFDPDKVLFASLVPYRGSGLPELGRERVQKRVPGP